MNTFATTLMIGGALLSLLILYIVQYSRRRVNQKNKSILTKDNLLIKIQLLEDVAAGKIDATIALSEWPEEGEVQFKTLASAWHHLSHFASDADIRAKDIRYANYQNKLLLQSAEALRGMVEALAQE